jgi:competence protein ComFC
MLSTTSLALNPLNLLLKAWNWLLDALFPRVCLGCGKYGSWCCVACFSSLKFPRQLYCPSCNEASALGEFCKKCAGDKNLSGVWVTQAYGNPLIRQLIHSLKYDYVKELAVTLGKILSANMTAFDLPPAWHQVPRENWYLVPIPLALNRLKSRNYNQAELLAQEVQKSRGLKIDLVLERLRSTKPQSKLQMEERLKNVNGVFDLKRGAEITGKAFILVDDVYTSGATMEECARVLKLAGAVEVWGLVVAKG